MFNYYIILLLFVATSYGNEFESIHHVDLDTGRDVLQTIELSNPYDAGTWGIIEICPNSSVITGAEVKWQEPSILDDTAINAIKLYCQDLEDGKLLGYITSTEGSKGSYRGIQSCTKGYVTGARAKVLGKKLMVIDEVAVQDFQLSCNYGTETVPVLPVDVKAHDITPEVLVKPVVLHENSQWSDKETRIRAVKDGNWSEWMECRRGLVLCGLQIRLQSSMIGDQVAVTDLTLFCCE